MSLWPRQKPLQAFRHGMPPQGGFALELERWSARLIEADNIRRTTLIPRDLQRLTPYPTRALQLLLRHLATVSMLRSGISDR